MQILAVLAVIGSVFTAVSSHFLSGAFSQTVPIAYTAPRGSRERYEDAGLWEKTNNALYDYCRPLKTCNKWRYQGLNLFFFYGDEASAPQNFTLSIGPDPVRTLTAVRCDRKSESIFNRAAMVHVLLEYCDPIKTCELWRYKECGTFEYGGDAMMMIL